MTTHSHSHAHSHAPTHTHPHADIEDSSNAVGTRIQRLAMFLEAHFGEVEFHMPDSDSKMDKGPEDGTGEPSTEEQPSLLVRLDEANAVINLLSMVSCTSKSRPLPSE